MEENKNVEVTEEQKKEDNKVVQFVKDHKWEIIGTTVVGIVGMIFLGRHISKTKTAKANLEKEGKEILDILSQNNNKVLDPFVKKVDEEVFTELAPELVDMIANKGIEQGWMERSFDLGGVTKTVEININKK